jgi:hypothetical protein
VRGAQNVFFSVLALKAKTLFPTYSWQKKKLHVKIKSMLWAVGFILLFFSGLWRLYFVVIGYGTSG